MTLIKETGAGVPNANTYADDTDLTTYAADRGITLPVTQPEREALLLRAMDYLETLGSRYLGYRVEGQVLQWPRLGVYFDGYLFPATSIPDTLVKVQVVIAIAAQTIELFPATSGVARVATRQTVGPITVEYSAQGASKSLKPIITQAEALLNILAGSAGTGGQLWVVRA